MPTEDEVVRTASEAAEGMIFSRYRRSAVRDLDITVTFEDGVLDIDVYLNPPDDADPDPEAVVEGAIAAAESAVDDLFATE
ncbi:DUF3194 domain-containing protein [Halococcus agarilyticus]|uniref:DUF3194 domain-containing protein n=1 Tax=Halococcus agarilyticus TaxID=1232219 RepID=UPI000677AD38|nr:DUF3194 domain-containing protein [Halococcus agarilyticus]